MDGVGHQDGKESVGVSPRVDCAFRALLAHPDRAERPVVLLPQPPPGVQDVVGQRQADNGVDPDPGFSVAFHLGSGGTDFLAAPTWDMVTPTNSFVVTDLDSDGVDDIVFQAENGADIGLFAGGGGRVAE